MSSRHPWSLSSFILERWADEEAPSQAGDRTIAARAVGGQPWHPPESRASQHSR